MQPLVWLPTEVLVYEEHGAVVGDSGPPTRFGADSPQYGILLGNAELIDATGVRVDEIRVVFLEERGKHARSSHVHPVLPLPFEQRGDHTAGMSNQVHDANATLLQQADHHLIQRRILEHYRGPHRRRIERAEKPTRIRNVTSGGPQESLLPRAG